MKKMFALLFVVPFILIGCDNVDTTGPQELSDYAGQLSGSVEVATAECDATTVAVGAVISCVARNANGSRLETGGLPLVEWTSTDFAVVDMDVSGSGNAVAVGTADVVASGPNGSSASVTITVQ